VGSLLALFFSFFSIVCSGEVAFGTGGGYGKGLPLGYVAVAATS